MEYLGTCSIYYGLDPVDDYTLPNFACDAMLKLRPSFLLYYTLPNFAVDAMLKLTGIEIDLVYNQEMYEMIEAGLRGGMTQTTCRKVEANNEYMGDDYDSSKESNYINFYLDANNLFGLSMLQKLQDRNLEWDDKITEEDKINYKNGSMDYMLEVDVEYPK